MNKIVTLLFFCFLLQICFASTMRTYTKFDVPYISQNDGNSCATTSLAMAISFYDKRTKPLDKEVVWQFSETNERLVKKYGNDMEGLKRIATHYGYKSKYTEQLSIVELEALLSKGILIVLNIRVKKNSRATHAILLTGYDKKKKAFYINDPASKSNKRLKYSDLMSRWTAHLSSPRGMSYRSGFIIYPEKI